MLDLQIVNKAPSPLNRPPPLIMMKTLILTEVLTVAVILRRKGVLTLKLFGMYQMML